MSLNEQRIIKSWHGNASPWTAAVRKKSIESRALVTDAAIIEAVTSHHPRSVIDIGCGEGWLASHLAEVGIDVLGVDVVADLIRAAEDGGGQARFAQLSYEALAQGALTERFDLAVCNFSLLGKESVEGLIAAIPQLLNAGGSFIVQTLHPITACGDQPYRDGWREGSWHGFDESFSDPAPWYFRTINAWVKLFVESGLTIESITEPVHPKTGKPASILFIVRRKKAR